MGTSVVGFWVPAGVQSWLQRYIITPTVVDVKMLSQHALANEGIKYHACMGINIENRSYTRRSTELVVPLLISIRVCMV